MIYVVFTALTYIGLIIGGALIGGILIGAMILKRNDHKAMLERSRARTSVQITQSKKKDNTLNGSVKKPDQPEKEGIWKYITSSNTSLS